jgi:hypothetical protein
MYYGAEIIEKKADLLPFLIIAFRPKSLDKSVVSFCGIVLF